MNMQPATQPKSSANGYGRRRVEKDGGGGKLDPKLQYGKSNSNRSTNAGIAAGGKLTQVDSPSHDRLIYLTTCLIGHPVEVHLKNGSVYSGVCYTTNTEKEFAIILKMARLTKDSSLRGQKTESISKAPSKTLILPGKDVVQVIAKDLPVTMDGISSDLLNARQQELMLDSSISQLRHLEGERELAPWVPDDDIPQCPELENIFDGPWNRGWDQFETNAMLFGVKSTFDEDLYTTRLERGPQMREREKEAMRIAREIECEDTQDLHLAEERGIHLHETHAIDEETRFSSVYRGGQAASDGGYEEVGDIILDSRNSETFGDPSAATFNKSGDLTHGKSSDGARGLTSASLEEAQCSQSGTGADLCHASSYDHSRQQTHPSRHLSTSNSETRIQENLYTENAMHDGIKELSEEQILPKDAQLQKTEDSLRGIQDGPDKVGLSPNATAYAPSPHASSKSQDNAVSHGELSDAAVPVKGVGEMQPSKGAGEVQSVTSRGRPGSSASSNSDRVGVTSATGGPGLSPSSSLGSLSSEKSTLNPHAKEFKLNPNAKSFTPSHGPVRPPSPMPDGSYYFQPNVSALPHMHGIPMGIGIGPSFTGHQPVIFNPPVAPLQTPQTYFHPGGPQYGQQMLLGHSRPLVYMPNFQPEMPYKGREF